MFDYRYKNKTYVFYLFPRPVNRLAPDTRFLCQSSSIDFLVSNNFDFNKLFREGDLILLNDLEIYHFFFNFQLLFNFIGIPYLNSTDESKLADDMEVKRNYKANQPKDNSTQTIPVPKQFKATIDNAMWVFLSGLIVLKYNFGVIYLSFYPIFILFVI